MSGRISSSIPPKACRFRRLQLLYRSTLGSFVSAGRENAPFPLALGENKVRKGLASFLAVPRVCYRGSFPVSWRREAEAGRSLGLVEQ